jgi:stage III sporulation protein AG
MAMKPKQWLTDLFGRYKYVLLVGLIGVGLLLLPGGKDAKTQALVDPPAATKPALEDQLELLLSQLQGAGRVKLLLTTAQGERYIYQTDSNAGQNGELRLETVIVSGVDRQENPVLQQTVGPVYQGAVVLCQGAADAAVRLAVVEAVSKATGLGADKICVLKMK